MGGFNEIRQERTGWRDAGLSARHRTWGWNCPAMDVDFMMMEYHAGKIAAFVEYKLMGAPIPAWDHPSMRAMRDASDRLGVPFFVTQYTEDFALWRPLPFNDKALQALYPSPGARASQAVVESILSEQPMSERNWVSILHRVRGCTAPHDQPDTVEEMFA